VAQIRAAIKIDHLSGFLGMELLKDVSKSLFSTNWLYKISCGIIPPGESRPISRYGHKTARIYFLI